MLHNLELRVSRCFQYSGEYKIFFRIIKFIDIILLMYQF